MSNLKVGDKVKWVHCKATRNGGLSMKSRPGVIEVLTDESARIGVGRGIFYWCPLDMVRPIAQPSALMDWIQQPDAAAQPKGDA